jgi:hypothetical protein
MKGRHHARFRQERLCLLGGGACRGRREEAAAAEGERHDRAHHDFATASRRALGQRVREAVGGQGDHDHLAQLGRFRVRVTDDGDLARALAQLRGLRLRTLGVARADDDRVAAEGPPRGQPRAFLAGAAQNRDLHVISRG